VLLADCFSGVRIGEKRWNVLWEGSCWRRGSIVRAPFSVKSILELFLSSLPALRHSTPGFRLSLWAVAPPRSKVSTNTCVVSRHPPHTLWCVPPRIFPLTEHSALHFSRHLLSCPRRVLPMYGFAHAGSRLSATPLLIGLLPSYGPPVVHPYSRRGGGPSLSRRFSPRFTQSSPSY